MPKYPKSTKKPSMAKAKQMVTKQRKKRASKNMDTFFLKAKTLLNVVPAQGVSVANYSYGLAQLCGGNFINNAEFVFYRLQYDKYRVNSVTIKWTPKANVFDLGHANDDGTYNLTGDGMIHTAIDRDGQAPSSIAALSRYPSYRKFSILKKWQRTYSIKYPVGIWLDCSDPFGNTSLISSLGLGGSVTWYGENFLEENYEVLNEPIAEISIEWNVVFQGKTTGSLTFTKSGGEITGVTITPVLVENNLALSPLTNVRGSVADTRTQDEATEVSITDQGVPA